MGAMDFIDEQTLDTLAAEPVNLLDDEQRENQSSYALKAANRELDLILDDEKVELGGLHVYTTLDTSWQHRLFARPPRSGPRCPRWPPARQGGWGGSWGSP